MPAPTLVALAKKACQKYHRRITSVGGLPYDMVRPILIRIDNAEQLYEIESNSPQIVGKDAEIWRSLVKRDIPRNTRDAYEYEPEDPSDWYRTYKKLKAKEEKQAAKMATELQNEIAKKKAAREAPKLVNPLNGPRLPGQKRPQRGITLAPNSRARVGKSILNDIRSDSRVKKPAKGGGLWIKPSKSNHVRRSYGIVAKAPVRMAEDRAEMASKKVSRPAEHTKPTPGSSSAISPPAGSTVLSIVEQRRQANERLKSIGLQAKETSPAKKPSQDHPVSAQNVVRHPDTPSVFMRKKKRL